MNNKLKNIFTVVFALSVFIGGYTVFSLRHTEKAVSAVGNYTEYQVNSAMNTVARHFTLHYPDCKLTRLYTDEKAVSSTDKLVIMADYDVGQIVQLHPSMNTGSTYTRWQFELKNICGLWIVTNQGYC